MEFQEELKQTFAQFNISLTLTQCERFETFYKMLKLWNERFNLTTITSQSGVIVKHFLDSVLPYAHLKEGARIIDIGSGAGFPGIPLKIMRDDLDVCLIDSSNKRVSFLKEVIACLELDNVLALHTRAEDLAALPHHRGAYDYAASRAVANLSTLLEISSPFVKVGGWVICYKSLKTEEEVLQAKNAFKILNLKISKTLQFQLDDSAGLRNIMFIEKNKPTPKVYPRGKNLPKTNPL